jgi:hypothetical protein
MGVCLLTTYARSRLSSARPIRNDKRPAIWQPPAARAAKSSGLRSQPVGTNLPRANPLFEFFDDSPKGTAKLLKNAPNALIQATAMNGGMTQFSNGKYCWCSIEISPVAGL